ncbi:MAG: cbb3-type cytochrome oxidase assembly protein CcoS [Planctomycetota bacterium]|nr:MAG: cbb3-type cytochrome oxidase assembly protein CcoS [Planctomycetota bacterium]
MELYFILTGLGFFLFLMAVTALIWMVRSGQMDDLDTPALRMLCDDEPTPKDPDEERPNERR